MRHPTDHIFHHTPESLTAWCTAREMPAFRAKQILDWVYNKGVADIGAMTNLSARDRAALEEGMTFLSARTVAHQRASDGTQKLLMEWTDGPAHADPDRTTGTTTGLEVLGQPGDSSRQTECVMIPSRDLAPKLDQSASGRRGQPETGPTEEDFDESDESDSVETSQSPQSKGPRPAPTGSSRKTACISSQIGCPVGCRFCASGLGGLDGNLSAGRIVEQAWRLARLEGVGRISNIVFMGMGEPLANFNNVIHAVRTLAAPWGMGISARKITISTVGLPQAIEKLATQLDLPITLALSLHAPTDELRRRLIPWAEYTTIDDLLDACALWYRKTGREITLEYTLLGGVNDKPEHARELSKVAKTLRANVNLIRFNEVKGVPYRRPLDEDVRNFQGILRDRGVNAHIRASRGRDISAACGQLRHEKAMA
jgi:23S rRNA (adenine2503-C2)-methyltransferase